MSHGVAFLQEDSFCLSVSESRETEVLQKLQSSIAGVQGQDGVKVKVQSGVRIKTNLQKDLGLWGRAQLHLLLSSGSRQGLRLLRAAGWTFRKGLALGPKLTPR